MPRDRNQEAPPALTEQAKEQLHDLLSAGRLLPAQEGHAAEYRSTGQIHSLVDAHCPGLIDIRVLREALIALNYQEVLVGQEYRWRIAER